MSKACGIAGLWLTWLATAVLADAVYDGTTRTIRITGKDNTLRSITQQIANPDVINYDYLGRSAICRANIIITTGDLIMDGENLQMEGTPTNRLMITVYPVGQLTVFNSTIGPSQESRGSVWGIDVNGSGGVLIAKDSEFVGGGIHNGTGSSPKIVAENVVFRRCETALYVYFPPTPDSVFDHLTFLDSQGYPIAAVGRANLVIANSAFATNNRALYFSRDGRVTTRNCRLIVTRSDDVLFDGAATDHAAWIQQRMLKITVVALDQHPLAEAEITVVDRDGQTVAAGKTDAGGNLSVSGGPYIAVTVGIQTKNGKQEKGTLRVRITHQGKAAEEELALAGGDPQRPLNVKIVWKED